MQKCLGIAAGKVVWIGKGESKNGKAYAIIQLELASREYNGRRYSQRVTIHEYQMKEQWAKGDFVSAAGEIEAQVEQGREGKSYGKLVMVGRLSRMDIPVMPAPTAEGSADEPA